MISTATVLMFIPASLLLIIAPGPDILFVITQGISSGRKAGFTTALGLAAGNSVHTLLAAFGIAVIFKNSAAAFTIFKFLGAGYLIFLSVKILLHFNDSVVIESDVQTRKKNLFLRGFIMNVVNPKVALFFMAFLPQFVDYSAGSASVQFLIFGGIFISLVVLVFGTIGLSAGLIGDFFMKRPGFSKIINIISVSVFILLALKIILMRQ
ncbi:MAG: LysE family translocator [Spirochaetes bacterium]|nr:LysE family translocator [Spirochaetota bacterium]